MHREQRAIRAAFLTAILVALFPVLHADSRLSLQCKNIARNVIINSCKGPRFKRGVSWLDSRKLDEELANIESTESSRYMTIGIGQQKRQFYPDTVPTISGLFGGAGLPELNAATVNFHKTEFTIPGLGYVEDEQSSFLEENIGHEMPIPYRPYGTYPVTRSIKSDELLGFDLSSEKLDELYDEFGERMPRNSKDMKKKIFQLVAAKCCPNPKLCFDNPNIIQCMEY